MKIENNLENLKIMHSDEYQAYMKALCRIASQYVSRIRCQFAEKAFEMYQNETVRKIVLAYGEEAEKLDERRLRDFRMVAEWRDCYTEAALEDDCLNAARHYASTVKMLFEIH